MRLAAAAAVSKWNDVSTASNSLSSSDLRERFPGEGEAANSAVLRDRVDLVTLPSLALKMNAIIYENIHLSNQQ